MIRAETHRPFLYIGGAYGLGIALSEYVRLPLSYSYLLIFALLLVGAGLSKNKVFSTGLLLLAIAGLGIVATQGRGHVPAEDIEHVARYYRRTPIEIDGTIASDIQRRKAGNGEKTTFTLEVAAVRAKWGWQKRTGKVLVNIFGAATIAYGDHVIIEGKLHRPYNFSQERNFSYREYLVRRGVRFILSVKKGARVEILEHGRGNPVRALSLRLRDRLKRVLSENLSENEAGIMKAILLGDRSAVPKAIRELFVQTGTAHILAISGLHMGIVAALFLVFAKILPVGRRWQLAAVIALVASYAFLTGARPSVVRAAVMTVIFLASLIVEKEFDMLNTLCLAGTAILVFNPLNLFDAGFQLSFSCVFAIIYANLRMKRAGLLRPKPRGGMGNLKGHYFDGWAYYVFQSLYLSFAIWTAVAGLVAYYFGIITPITTFANVAVIPLISIIVALGFGLLSIGIILPSGAFMFALCLKVVLNLTVGLTFLFDKVPFAYIYIREISLWHVTAYYAVMSLIVFVPWRYFIDNLRRVPANIFKSGGIDKRQRV